MDDIPAWYKQIPSDADALYAVATAESRDMQLAVDKATQNARVEVGRQVEIRLEAMTKRFQEETGGGQDAELLDMATTASKSVVSQTLNGARAARSEIKANGGLYRAFVLVQMPIGPAHVALMEKVKASERAFTRYRASEAFKELDAEVKKFEEFKKKQP